MAKFGGHEGALVSWAYFTGQDLADEIADAEGNFRVPGRTFDTTALGGVQGGTPATAFTKGLRTWNARIRGYQASPTAGYNGSVTHGTTAYVTNVRSWGLTVVRPVIDTTDFGNSSRWQTSVPGASVITATYEAFVDDTTAPVMTGDPSTDSVFTFSLGSSNNYQFTGHTVDTEIVQTQTEAVLVRYQVQGTGTLAITGTNAGTPALTVSNTAAPAAELTWKVKESGGTDQELSGDAYWTSISAACTVDGRSEIVVEAQGTGAITGDGW